MRFRDALALGIAAGLIVAGLGMAWLPLAFISLGMFVAACWYWLIDEDGAEQ